MGGELSFVAEFHDKVRGILTRLAALDGR